MSTSAQATAKSAPTKSGGSILPWIIIAVLVLGSAGAGGWFWWQSNQAGGSHAAGKGAPLDQIQYFALEPAFVVNMADGDAVRYLQADVQLVTRDPETRTAIEVHTPAIRNRLLLLFGQQSSKQVLQRAGKERLQQAALIEVRQLLKKEGAANKVEAVIFTSLVTQ